MRDKLRFTVHGETGEILEVGELYGITHNVGGELVTQVLEFVSRRGINFRFLADGQPVTLDEVRIIDIIPVEPLTLP